MINYGHIQGYNISLIISTPRICRLVLIYGCRLGLSYIDILSLSLSFLYRVAIIKIYDVRRFFLKPRYRFTKSMIHNKFRLIRPGCLRPSIVLIVQNRGLKHHSFFSNDSYPLFHPAKRLRQTEHIMI